MEVWGLIAFAAFIVGALLIGLLLIALVAYLKHDWGGE